MRALLAVVPPLVARGQRNPAAQLARDATEGAAFVLVDVAFKVWHVQPAADAALHRPEFAAMREVRGLLRGRKLRDTATEREVVARDDALRAVVALVRLEQRRRHLLAALRAPHHAARARVDLVHHDEVGAVLEAAAVAARFGRDTVVGAA